MALELQRPQPIRVAIVDDHRLVLDGILAHIVARDDNITVVIAATTWAGLMNHAEFPVDVVVLDLNLEDGIGIATKVRALSAAGIATVVMSRHTDGASIYGAVHAGALGFIPKSDRADELVHAIRAAADGKQYLNPPFLTAQDGSSPSADPGLGRQELRALVHYAGGRTIHEVAVDMGTTDETVKSYIKRGRRKYRDIGIDVGTKTLLRSQGVREGWLSPE
jgi:two-component system uhpT operon response regulator UhpA